MGCEAKGPAGARPQTRARFRVLVKGTAQDHRSSQLHQPSSASPRLPASGVLMVHAHGKWSEKTKLTPVEVRRVSPAFTCDIRSMLHLGPRISKPVDTIVHQLGLNVLSERSSILVRLKQRLAP